jgi:actin
MSTDDAVVIDVGAYRTRVGISQEDGPRTVFPTVRLLPRYHNSPLDDTSNLHNNVDYFLGDVPENPSLRRQLSFRQKEKIFTSKDHFYPGSNHSQICDLSVAEDIWRRCIFQGGSLSLLNKVNLLRKEEDDEYRTWNATHTKKVFLTEEPLPNARTRTKTTEIMFEKCEVEMFYMAKTSVLGVYAAGKITGCSVDCGHTETRVIPVYEGHQLPHALIGLNDIAGRSVRDVLAADLIEHAGISAFSESELNHITDHVIEQDFCFCEYPNQNQNQQQQTTPTSFTTPDGKRIHLPSSSSIEKIFKGKTRNIFSLAPELLFRPYEIAPSTFYEDRDFAIQDAVANSVMRADPTERREMLNNIVCFGGGSRYKGFNEKLKYELDTNGIKAGSSIARFQTRVHDQPTGIHQSLQVWIGGSILSSLSTFQEMWISKEEYDESGPDIVFRKCYS